MLLSGWNWEVMTRLVTVAYCTPSTSGRGKEGSAWTDQHVSRLVDTRKVSPLLLPEGQVGTDSDLVDQLTKMVSYHLACHTVTQDRSR